VKGEQASGPGGAKTSGLRAPPWEVQPGGEPTAWSLTSGLSWLQPREDPGAASLFSPLPAPLHHTQLCASKLPAQTGLDSNPARRLA
jgi:hypothetical protein